MRAAALCLLLAGVSGSRLRGDRRQADDHGAGQRQRRPGARGLLALRDTRRDATEPGRGRYGVLLRGTQITELRNIKVVFFDIQGTESSTLTAKRGTYRWQDGSMEANDNVLVVSPDGRRLKTEALKYDNAANTISTNVHFTFDRGGEHLEGNSFRSDPDFKNVVTDRPRGVAGDGMLLPGQEP